MATQMIKMRDLPPEERPYEKCEAYGPEYLSDRELLAVILRTGSRELSALDLADRILDRLPGSAGLLTIHHLSLQQLRDIPGIGRVKALQIKCIGELSKRMASSLAKPSLSYNDPESIARYYMEKLRHEDREQVILLLLDTRNHLLGDPCISSGTVDMSLVTPREILMTAVSYHAVNLIMIHNHPSGDPAASDEDIRMTKAVQETLTLAGFHLLDHIIIGDQSYTSLLEEGCITRT